MTRTSFAQTAAQIEVDAQALEAVLDKVSITVLKTAARIYRFAQANVDPADIPVKGLGRAATPAITNRDVRSTHTAADRARAYRARGGDELRARNAERMRRKRAQERLAKQAPDNVLVLH